MIKDLIIEICIQFFHEDEDDKDAHHHAGTNGYHAGCENSLCARTSIYKCHYQLGPIQGLVYFHPNISLFNTCSLTVYDIH
jgi:hypothetical protein